MEPRGIAYPEWGSAPRSRETYQDHTHRGEVLDPLAGGAVIRCETCLLTHVVPLPDEATLRGYYQSTFYQGRHPDYVARYEEDRAWWAWVHTLTLEAAEAVLGGPGAVLDIGTGPGIFLDVAQARGWQTAGLEPNDALAWTVRGRGHLVFVGTLATYLAETRVLMGHLPTGEGVDCLHLYEVLEHVGDPQEFLLEAAPLLKPGGLLHVVVPNDYNVLQMAACEALHLPHWWLDPSHLTYFTAKTLQLLVRRCGFDLVDLRGTYPMEFFLLQGRNYVGDDAVGRQCHRERMALELGLAHAGLTAHLLAWYRENVMHPYSGAVGRELVCLARKRP